MLFTEQTLGGLLEAETDAHPDREFIVYADHDLRWTYAQFNRRVDCLAKGLMDVGIGKGDHVGVWATNVPDWMTYLYACAKIGAVFVTINTHYKSHELEFVLKQSDMKAIALIDRFRDTDYIETVHGLVPELAECEIGRLQSEGYPHLRLAVYMGRDTRRGMYNTEQLLEMGAAVPEVRLREAMANQTCDDVVNMQYTSGTTGFPKGVMLTHRNIVNNGYYIGECQDFTGADRVCLPVPFFHCFGLVLGLMAVVTHGATTVPVEVFDPVKVLAAVEKEKCTALYGVPTMFIAELNHPMFDMFDLSSLRTGIMAGSPCPIEVMNQVVEKMHCTDITIAYGLTEASPVFTQTRTDDSIERRVSTVGRAHPHIEVKIVDPETGQTVGPNVPGEICCRGYNVMKGYYNMPQDTARVIDADGWLHSGDLATVDEDGYYRIVGRIKDMIIRGGENISPREVEEFLYTIEGVKDVQVVGVPDAKYGEVVGAFVILRDGSTLTADEIRDYARSRIARYKVPKHVFFVDSYPSTASGKIQKFKLREMAAEMVGADPDAVFDDARQPVA